MPITDTTLRSVKPSDKPQKLFDGHGLFLLVSPNGSKAWRLKYYINGKEKLLSLGKYPLISLKEARERANSHRKSIENGIDPSFERKMNKQQQKITFQIMADEWLEMKRMTVSEARVSLLQGRLNRYILPAIGAMPINQITGADILAKCKKAEAKGTAFIPGEIRSNCSQIFRYAIATGKAERNPANDIQGAVLQYTSKNFPTITTPEEVANLLLAIDNYEGTMLVRNALKLLVLTFVRSNELRNAEWSEIDYNNGLWRIPAEKMKMRRDHIVPLSKQSIAILKTIQPFSGDGIYVFPNYRDDKRCISKSTLHKAVRQLGIEKGSVVPHGFRAMASTLLNEQGYNADWIERQLAHAPRNIIRGIYNRAEYLPERRKMMQDWADYLDDLRNKRLEELANSKT